MAETWQAGDNMALESEPKTVEDDYQENGVQGQDCDAPSHHPSAPPDELFDIATTVDPSYIISLIRKLIPSHVRSTDSSHGSNVSHLEESTCLPSDNKSNDNAESMEIVYDLTKSAHQGGGDEDLGDEFNRSAISAGEEVWEECGCILWDLAASRANAELMVQNLVLEVLLANLMVAQSIRITEICLGIIGNLACHEVPMKHIVSKSELVETVLNKFFLDDTQCLCEVFRLLTWGLQGGECITWANALQSEHILSRILWVAENTLNPQLIEKSIGLLLAILESQQEVMRILLPPLMKLGFPSLLICLFTFEMGKLSDERAPERYSALDVILRAIEALSVVDGHSHEICSKKELFKLICELLKLPDKIEIATSCVTAAVLIANFLSDVPDLALEISQEARSALWSIIARLLVLTQENDMTLSSLRQFVSVLCSKCELIEDDLLDHELDDSSTESESQTSFSIKDNARNIALRRVVDILNRWTTSTDCLEENDAMGEHHADANVGKLLECCQKHIKSSD
ncbi:uncharacterized protein LOC120012045 isoform X2 [Tripterygium wilfordii]|uniref:uncharacterized protein LOC120012045 isoform X2 n=1 Tax=Tripterygium wilfordii TaxID=458696 RepID=UPI0018F7F124|nr:uncharacterized protein LOC120012045 isoform X2 [Tripterygium wilfordii]